MYNSSLNFSKAQDHTHLVQLQIALFLSKHFDNFFGKIIFKWICFAQSCRNYFSPILCHVLIFKIFHNFVVASRKVSCTGQNQRAEQSQRARNCLQKAIFAIWKENLESLTMCFQEMKTDIMNFHQVFAAGNDFHFFGK